MWKALIFLSLVLNSYSNANQTTERIDQQNKGGYSEYSNEYYGGSLCQNCNNNMFPFQCIDLICKNNNVKETYDQLRQGLVYNNYDQFEEYANEFKPQLIELAKKEFEKEVRDLQRLSTLIRNKQMNFDVERNPAFSALVMLNVLNNEVYPEFKEVQTDAQAALKKLIEPNDRLAYELSPERYLKVFYPNRTTVDALRQLAKDLNNSVKDLSSTSLSKYPGFMGSISGILNSPYLKDIRENKPIDTKNVAEFIINLQNIRNVYKLLTVKTTINYSLKDAEKAIYNPRTLNEIENRINESQKYIDNPKKIEELYSSCLTNYAVGRLGLPAEADLKKHLKTASIEKSKFINKLSSIMSEKTMALVKPTLQKQDFILPQSKESLKISALTSLSESSKSYERENADMQKLSDAEFGSMGMYIALGYALATPPKNLEKKLLRSLTFDDSTCKNLNPPVLNDSAYSTSNDILISWGSLASEKGFSAIIHHEMGHILFDFLATNNISFHSSQKIYSAVQCLNENHKGDSIVKTYANISKIEDKPTDTKITLPSFDINNYTGEDFADMISAFINSPENNNIGCFFFNQNSAYGSGQYKLTRTEDDTDEHSTDFYRILSAELNIKGSLPEECRQFVEGSTPKLTMKACLPIFTGSK